MLNSTHQKNRSIRNGDKDGKAFHKLMNNAVYCKTMDNLRNRINVRLVNNRKDYLKWTSKPSCISHIILGNDLVVIRKSKVTLTLNKPGNVGRCISDLSKVSMYEFHYNYIKNRYGNNSRLLFIDTNSFMFEITSEDVYEDLNKDKEMFDFSNYSAKPKYFDDSNKLVGKMKDKAGGVAIKEFHRLEVVNKGVTWATFQHQARKTEKIRP